MVGVGKWGAEGVLNVRMGWRVVLFVVLIDFCFGIGDVGWGVVVVSGDVWLASVGWGVVVVVEVWLLLGCCNVG